MYAYLSEELSTCAKKHGERVLNIKHNPISLGRSDCGVHIKSQKFTWSHGCFIDTEVQ